MVAAHEIVEIGRDHAESLAFDILLAAYARAFSPTIGLWEDSATGTAAGPLAAYLARKGLLHGGTLTVEQGVKIGRRSVLKITLEPDPVLSGAGIITLRGVLRI